MYQVGVLGGNVGERSVEQRLGELVGGELKCRVGDLLRDVPFKFKKKDKDFNENVTQGPHHFRKDGGEALVSC